MVERDWLLFEGVTGSQAYGTDTPASDLDLKGVYLLPIRKLLGLEYLPQISDERHNEVYYELGRFVELLAKNNPSLLEMLALPEECVRVRHPLYARLTPDLFLSRMCKDTFAGYAMDQIKKARGLNKKILNPMPREKKTVLDFCYVLHRRGSKPLNDWLRDEGLQQEHCGLARVNHAKDVYALYYDPSFRGIMRKAEASNLLLTSIPEDMAPLTHLYFNQDGFTKYCKDYADYWRWVEMRNEERYQNTLEHGKNYDAKNMMHTFRLLDMAEEILRDGRLIVRRGNREELMEIRSGRFSYDELIERAERKLAAIEELAPRSPLPERPDVESIERALVEVRLDWYRIAD